VNDINRTINDLCSIIFLLIHKHHVQISLIILLIIVLQSDLILADTQNPMDAPDNRIILHGGDWDSFKLINAIASYILKNGYGYTPQIYPEPEKKVSESLSSRTVDISLEVWKENHPPELQNYIEIGAIIDMGKIYENAAHTYIIPDHVAQQYSIRTMEDMQHYWYLCKDPEEPTKGLFYNALITWLVHDSNLKKLDAYGLSPYYNPVTMPSSRAYEEVFMKAARENRTVFGMYWIPSAVMGTGYWKELEEPTLPSCTNETILNLNLVNANQSQICPFTSSSVHKLVSRDFYDSAPEVVSFLIALKPDENEISRTLTFGYLNNISDWDRLSEEYLINNEEKWKSWVSTDAYIRIKRTLAVNTDETE